MKNYLNKDIFKQNFISMLKMIKCEMIFYGVACFLLAFQDGFFLNLKCVGNIQTASVASLSLLKSLFIFGVITIDFKEIIILKE